MSNNEMRKVLYSKIWRISPMENMITTFQEILKKELTIYMQILSISQKKTDIIIKGKISELDMLVKEEQELISALGKLESSREEVIIKICEALNLKSSEVTMTDILEKLHPNQASALNVIRNKLLELTSELKTINDNNGKLIKNSLEFIDFSINVLSDAANPGNNYNSTGYSGGASQKSVFDKKL